MPFALAAPLIGAGISALAGLFGGKKQQEVKTSSDTTNNFNQTSTSTPNLNPFQQQLAKMFTEGAMDQYRQSVNLSPYASQGLQQIQGQAGANAKIIGNVLAQRGLSFSPAAVTSMLGNTLNAGNQANQFLAGIPLLSRQLQDNSLGNLIRAFGAMPVGMTQTGSGSSTSHMEGVNTQSGNPTAGFLGGLGAGLFAPNVNGGSGTNLSAILDAFRPKNLPMPSYGTGAYGGSNSIRY